MNREGFTAHGFKPQAAIDLGLDIIRAVQPFGVPLSCEDIAAVCGCTPQAIRHVYNRALAKMQRAAAERKGAEV